MKGDQDAIYSLKSNNSTFAKIPLANSIKTSLSTIFF